jgi:molybdenum cofactor cytidylyltransferase
MLSSCQVGLRELTGDIEAALIVLGDQPQIQSEVVREVLEVYRRDHAGLVVPSYRMHRGHPWLVRWEFWTGILDLQSPATMRDFLNQHQDQITYVMVNTDSILKDLDTPADYQQEKPKV